MSELTTNENTDCNNAENEINESSHDKQARRFCITINNPTETDEEMFTYLQNLEHIKYFIFSREKGNMEGTIHLQMFLIFTIGKRFSTIKKLFPKAHIESAKGSNTQNRDYCSKNDTHISGPFEFGEFAEQGARKDLKAFFDLVNAGATDYELQCLYPKLYEKNVSKLAAFRNAKILNDYSKSLREDLIVTYIYGSTGVGKTYCIMKKYDKGSFYRITDYIKDPWQDYVDQKIVVFDEFRSQFPMVNMLNFLDIYPVSLPARFSNKITCYNRLFIISNIPPSSQYSNYKVEEPETYKAFNRRIHHVVHLTKEKCTVEKSRDIEELKSILPEEYLAKLDLSSFIYNKALENNKNAHQERIIQFEPIDDEDLPF